MPVISINYKVKITMIKSLTFREGCSAYYEGFIISLRSVKNVLWRGLVSYIFIFLLLGCMVCLTSACYDYYYDIPEGLKIFEGLVIFITIMLFFVGVIDIACRVVNNEKITMLDFLKIYIRYKLWLKSFAVIALPFVVWIIASLLFWGSVSLVSAIKIKHAIPFFIAEGVLSLLMFGVLLSYYYIIVGTIYSLYLISPNGQNLTVLDAAKQSFTGVLKNIRAVLSFVCCTVVSILLLFIAASLLAGFPFGIVGILSSYYHSSGYDDFGYGFRIDKALSAAEAWCAIIVSIAYFIFCWTSLVFFCITGKKIFINEHGASSQSLTKS